nr:PD40 domain-containing protein [candidate division Zixibacteria bacterium]
MDVRKILFIIIPFLSVTMLLYSCDKNDDTIATPKPIRPSRAYPRWSPDGEWIAFIWNGYPDILPNGIHKIRPDGSDLQPILILNQYYILVDLAWSHDCNWLVFTAPGYGGNVFKIRSNGDNLTQLTYSGDIYTCDWSYSDSLIAYNRISNDSGGIWLMDPSGSNKRCFIEYGSHFDFTNGDSLFYITFLDWNHLDSSRMNFISVSDSTERLIYKWEKGKPYTTYYDPDVSPDGNNIVFSLDDDIRILNTIDKHITTLTTNSGVQPSWSPNGEYIVYCESGEPDFEAISGPLRIMRSDGGENHILVDFVELSVCSNSQKHQ